MAPPAYVRVVVDVGPAHLDRLFDYALPEGVAAGPDPAAEVGIGSRLRVPFHGRLRPAWVAELAEEPATDPARVKAIDRVEGPTRWFDAADLAVWRWVADRFAGTLAGVIRHALPPRVVRVEREAAGWGPPPPPEDPAGEARPPCAGDGWRAIAGSSLLRAAWSPAGEAFHLRAPLHPADGEGPLLADLVARCAAGGRQAVVVVPSPAPGPADDVVAALGTAVADLRGDVSDADRYRAFLRARRGDVAVVVGERGVALQPVRDLGLLVVLDEASPAHKERRDPRHHVREAALARARMTGATAVLTSSVVSAPAWRHHLGGHLALVRADRAAERDRRPATQVVDRRALPPSARRTRLVRPVADAVARTLGDGGRVVVLAAAKGSGTSLACTTCRARHECPTCGAGVAEQTDRSMVDQARMRGGSAIHRDPSMVDQARMQGGSAIHGDPGSGWACAACGWTGPARACIDCGGTDSFPLRAGAGRFAAELARTFPDAEVVHMEGFDQPGPSRSPAIAVMTRGSVVGRPRWLTGPDGRPGQADLLVVADPDVLLGRPSVDAAEDALRLWLDAARLARAVLVQTGQPDHPALQALVRADPDGFWSGEAERRAALAFPPAGSLVRMTGLDAEAAAETRAAVPGRLLGPGPDGAALVTTTDLRGTLSALAPLRRRWALESRRVRVDVDPVDLG